MKPILISTASEPQINWLVANLEGHEPRYSWMLEQDGWEVWQAAERAWGNPIPAYTQDPIRAQRIATREKIGWFWVGGHPETWSAANPKGTSVEDGPTPLIAAMRCYLVSKLGDTAEVPKGLP